MTLKYWTCRICKKKIKETSSYKENLRLSFSLYPKKNICMSCYDKEGNEAEAKLFLLDEKKEVKAAMTRWSHYRIKTKVLDDRPNESVIDILSDELECSTEDIEWIGNKEEKR